MNDTCVEASGGPVALNNTAEVDGIIGSLSVEGLGGMDEGALEGTRFDLQRVRGSAEESPEARVGREEASTSASAKPASRRAPALTVTIQLGGTAALQIWP